MPGSPNRASERQALEAPRAAVAHPDRGSREGRLRKPESKRSIAPPSGTQKRGHAYVGGWLVAWGITELETEMSRIVGLTARIARRSDGPCPLTIFRANAYSSQPRNSAPSGHPGFGQRRTGGRRATRTRASSRILRGGRCAVDRCRPVTAARRPSRAPSRLPTELNWPSEFRRCGRSGGSRPAARAAGSRPSDAAGSGGPAAWRRPGDRSEGLPTHSCNQPARTSARATAKPATSRSIIDADVD